ncbi:ABC transporter permease [Candidatus Formimonas warabiya]|uniref:Transport permease protein n=1 Tax=Formimonas warabiya TaxID=1761012 RepID=A0A3G1KYL8_FORW1|nr:ABC transporter permease [Candidatus Formimonas warabiya]ATW27584.1 multidrug ABC transporter permease [Candidatus Formimonas warabiya]
MEQFKAVLWQDYIFFKRKFWSNTVGTLIGPLLYLLVFGWGLGSEIQVGGSSYVHFVIPGIIALTTMGLSFGNVANDINIARIYSKSFEELMVAPLPIPLYAAAKVTAGALRGFYAALMIIALSLILRVGLGFDAYFILVTLLNCYVFAALGFAVGLIIESHRDIAKFSNFIITPMSFLCGTFFPLDKMPWGIKEFIWLLPLTQTSLALRGEGGDIFRMFLHPAILLGYFALFFVIGIKVWAKAE